MDTKQYLKKEGINLINIEIIFSIILLINLILSQIYFNFYKLIDLFVIFSLFLNYYIFTFIEKKYNSIYLRLLNIFFLIFFLLRISFLNFEEFRNFSIFFSSTIDYFNINNEIVRFNNTESITKYLILLSYNYFSLSLALILFRPKKMLFKIDYVKTKYINIVLLIIIFQIILISVNNFYFPIETRPDKNIALLKIFFHIFNLDKTYIFLAFLSIIVFKLEYVPRIKQSVVLVSILSIIFATIVFHSKSSFLEFTLYGFIIYLLVDNNFFIKNKNFKYIIYFLILFLLFYILGKFFKNIYYGKENLITTIINFKNTIFDNFFTISERIGFFDYYMLIASNEKGLGNIFEYQNYFKAIIDKLTPFFDLFNSMLLSRQTYAYFNGLNATISQSYQITLFAEMQILFGVYSIIFYLFLSIILKFLTNFLQNLKISNNLKILLIFFILKSYFFYLIGYGMDTFIINIIYDSVFLIAILIIYKFYKNYVK